MRVRSPIKRRVDNEEFNSPVKKQAKLPPPKEVVVENKPKKLETPKVIKQ